MFSGIRPAQVPDYDGDGNKDESLKAEIKGLEMALYAQIQAYGLAIGMRIIYDSHLYPYFFNDSNGNGAGDPSEVVPTNRYSFNAKVLKVAYKITMQKYRPRFLYRL